MQFPRATRLIVGFQYRHEAEHFLLALRERFAKFGLALHPDKTRLLEFGRFAVRDRQRRGQGKPEGFDFLRFTHLCGRMHRSGDFNVKRKTVAKRLRATLHAVKRMLLQHRHQPLVAQGTRLRRVVQGWLNYHAIPGNMPALDSFRTQVVRHWLFALRRRSQRSRLPWERFGKLAACWIPRPRILHPYPNVRFHAQHPR